MSASIVFDVNELSRMNKSNLKLLTSSKSSSMGTSLTEKKRKPKKLKNQKKRLFTTIFTDIASSISAADLRRSPQNLKSSSDFELRKSEERIYQKANPGKIEQNCQRLPKSDSDQTRGEHDYQETGESVLHKYWNNSDSELMISTGQNFQEDSTDKNELHKYWNNSDPEVMKSTGQNFQEASTDKNELHNYWKSSDHELMISAGQTDRATQTGKSSESPLTKSSELKYEEAQAENQQYLCMRRSFSLPELLNIERKNIWAKRNSLRSV